jgi:hypothetical protein
MPDHVTRLQVGRVFAVVTRAGEASRRPYESKGHVNDTATARLAVGGGCATESAEMV